MKRSISDADEELTGQYGRSLEVPYAFGKLNVVEMVDPVTKEPTGVFNVMEKERGFSFGILKLSQEEATSDVNCINEKFIRLNTNDPELSTPSQTKKLVRNMMKQKKENDYLPEAQCHATSKSVSSLQSHIENLSLPQAAMQWGQLSFYCHDELVYTHYLWGDEPISVNSSTLKNVEVPPKFVGGHSKVESLTDDFRSVLARGFTLQRDNLNQTIEFQKVDENTNYKLFMQLDKGVDVTSNDSKVVLFDERQIQSQLAQEVNSLKSAVNFVHTLNVAIVLQNRFMACMGVTLDRTERKDLTNMPYYMLLKFHVGYDSLNAFTTKLINKYLTKKNNLFGQVLNVDADLNLKALA